MHDNMVPVAEQKPCRTRCGWSASALSYIQDFCGFSVFLSACALELLYRARIPQAPAVQENHTYIYRYDIERLDVYSFFQADIHSQRFMAALEIV